MGDRVIRVIRMALQGSRTAIVAAMKDVDGDYIRIDIQGTELKGGVAYLCFPTLGWHFWETHPFSVAFNPGSIPEGPSTETHAPARQPLHLTTQRLSSRELVPE